MTTKSFPVRQLNNRTVRLRSNDEPDTIMLVPSIDYVLDSCAEICGLPLIDVDCEDGSLSAVVDLYMVDTAKNDLRNTLTAIVTEVPFGIGVTKLTDVDLHTKCVVRGQQYCQVDSVNDGNKGVRKTHPEDVKAYTWRWSDEIERELPIHITALVRNWRDPHKWLMCGCFDDVDQDNPPTMGNFVLGSFTGTYYDDFNVGMVQVTATYRRDLVEDFALR